LSETFISGTHRGEMAGNIHGFVVKPKTNFLACEFMGYLLILIRKDKEL